MFSQETEEHGLEPTIECATHCVTCIICTFPVLFRCCRCYCNRHTSLYICNTYEYIGYIRLATRTSGSLTIICMCWYNILLCVICAVYFRIPLQHPSIHIVYIYVQRSVQALPSSNNPVSPSLISTPSSFLFECFVLQYAIAGVLAKFMDPRISVGFILVDGRVVRASENANKHCI